MRVKRKCELCSNIATIYCESDQANLCYECDSKVHGANFLVAKHSRTLLCHVCQSLTLWSGSGPKFGPTISVCPSCLNARQHRGTIESTDNNINGNGHEVANEDLDDDDDYEDEDEDEDEDEASRHNNEDEEEEEEEEEQEDDEENQVVPWSYSVSHPR